MGKKIDLSQKHNNSAYRINKNTRPIAPEYEENNDIPSEDMENEDQYQENNNQSTNHGFFTGFRNGFRGMKKPVINPIFSNNNSSDEEKVEAEIKKTIKRRIIKKVLLIAIPIILGILGIVLLVAIIIAIFGGNFGSNNLATRGYYAMRCSEVTVIFVDKSNGYEVTGTGTYSLKDYVAGVVRAEVGQFNDLEVYKAFALAARTYLLTHDDACTIESSDRRQVFKDITDRSSYPYSDLIYQAVEETAGQVILSNNELYSISYDAFCSIAVDDNYYTIKQQNQKIPRSWVDSQGGIADSWKQGTCAGNHGKGISQWGSYYLSSELGYTYDQILNYYLGSENITISSGALTSIAGLEIKDTTGTTQLNVKLEDYLLSNGSSVENLNSFIYDSVSSNGKGTRAGVVTAAVSLINYLNDNFNVRIPYYWAGEYQRYGVDRNFGNATDASCSNTRCYYYDGFDCSGFVSWAIKNGGYNIDRKNTSEFHSTFSGNSCNVKDSNCIGKPGDLINSSSCHVQMIVAVDEASGKYYIAESTGSYGLIMHEQSIHSGNCGSQETRILFMDEFYNNTSNVDPNY